MNFQELNLPNALLRALRDKEYERPTPIQMQAIPAALEGRDILGTAQTGTGKTAAFALPVLANLLRRPPVGRGRPIRALILTPTRELALQIDESLGDYAKYTPLRTCVVFGGVNQRPQIDCLKRGVDVLTATPGRLLDLIGQGHISLKQIEFFVLDEADRMLDMGFIHDIRRILPLLPRERQTLFFSATMPDDIVKLANTMLRNPAHVTVTPPASVVETIRQSVLFAEKAEKRTLLASLLRERPESSVLVFSRTKHGADRIARILTKAGIEGRAIHGDKSQGARERAMNDFRSGACRVLIATDIAARGIDISELPLVINYDLPEVPETYVHRIGRTGRAGRDGQAIAFCSEEERPLLKDILKLTGLELDPDSGELAPAQNSRKKPAGKKPDTAQTGGQKQAEEKRASQKQPAQSQAGQRPGRRKPQGQAPGDPKPQGQRTGGKQTPDGQQPQDKDAAARPARRRNRNRGRQKPDRQNAAAANTGRRQDDRKSGSQKSARDKREAVSPEAPRKTQAPEKKKSGMGSWLSGILRPGRK